METKKYILIVEDEAVTAKLLESTLLSEGYEAGVVSNGQEALKIVQVRPPDLIISDVVMPEMDGYTFYKELKKNPICANIPMIILTARSKMEDTFAVLGADEFFIKPFQRDVLLEKVRVLLQRKKAISPAVETSEKVPAPTERVASGHKFNYVLLLAIFLGVGAGVFLIRNMTRVTQDGVIKIDRDGLPGGGQNQMPEKILRNLEFR